MCAINPVHKKRLILDVYTSDSRLTKEQFNDLVLELALAAEMRLNESMRLRWHVKETKQEAE